MRHYLFFVNHLYSYSILRPLQRAIRARGDEVAWFIQGADDKHLRADEKQLHTVAEVKEYNPVAVFVPGNWVPDFFPGIKVEVFHGLANDETGKKGHYRIRGLFDLYCTHAPAITSKFQSLADQYRTFRVAETGWPKLDPLFRPELREPSPFDDLRNKQNINKPIVFYASTFSPSLTSAPYLFETIKKISRSSRWHWLVTLHPKMPEHIVDQYKSLQSEDFTYVDSSYDVLPLLEAADVMLCDTSSIALEFMLLNKPLVTYKNKVPGRHLLNVEDAQEVESAIARALSNPDELLEASKAYVSKLHAYDDGQSSERVLQAVDDFVTKGYSGLKKKPLNLWRKIQMRKKMHYFKL